MKRSSHAMWITGVLFVAVASTMATPTVSRLKCTVVLADADHATVPAGAKYAGTGVWTDAAGRTLGYSVEEDSIIWNTARCAATHRLYQP